MVNRKIVLMVVLMILSVSLMIVSVNGSVFDGVLHYWDFNSSTNLINTTGNFANGEGTMNYTTFDSKIGYSGRFDVDKNINIPAGVVTFDGDYTYNLWIKTDNAAIQEFWFVANQPNGHLAFNTANQWYVESYFLGGSNWNAGYLASDTWYMFTLVQGHDSPTNNSIYINGQINYSNNASANVNHDKVRWLGRHQNGALELHGYMDEMGYWGRALSNSEIQSLYNSGLGITYEPPEYVNVTIVYPLKYINYTINVTDLNYTYSYDSSPVTNCWYSLDNGLTNTTITCGDRKSVV